MKNSVTTECTESQPLPDLPDMMAVGMGLTDALAFWSLMMNTPERKQIDWWLELRKAVSPSIGALGSSPKTSTIIED